MSMQKFDGTKLREAILYIASIVPPEKLGKTKLFKILFFSDFRFFKRNRESITGEKYINLDNGPVPSNTIILNQMEKDDELKLIDIKKGKHIQKSVVARRKPDLSLFTQEELETLKEAALLIAPLSASRISQITHGFDLWEQTRQGEYIPYALLFNDDSDDMSDGGFSKDEELLVHCDNFKNTIKEICLNGR